MKAKMLKLLFVICLILIPIAVSDSCKKEEQEKNDFYIVDVSAETEWDYWVVGKEKESFLVKFKESIPSIIYHKPLPNLDGYAIFLDSLGIPNKAIIEDYVLLFGNIRKTLLDVSVVFPNGEIKLFRDVNAKYDFSSGLTKSDLSSQSLGNNIKWASRAVGLVACVTGIVLAVPSAGSSLLLALSCGSWAVGTAIELVADEDFEILGITAFEIGAFSTAVGCAVGSPTCVLGIISKATYVVGDAVEFAENNMNQINTAKIQLFNGLIAYYPFNGNANDLSGNNNHGTPYGVTPIPDRHGTSNSAYLFDGIDDYIEINHSSSLNLSQQISITFWVKFETSANYYWPYHIIEKFGCWGTGQRENDLNWGVTSANGEFNNWTLNYLYNRYYHIVQVYDGTKLYTYCDGILKSSTSASGLLKQNTNKVYISRYNLGGDYFFDGTLDDFRIYNRALTQQEITTIYNE